MKLKYDHTIVHPATGDTIDVVFPDEDQPPGRDALTRRLYGRGPRKGFGILRPSSHAPHSGTQWPSAPIPQPQPQPTVSTASVQTDGEYVAIRKDAVASLLPIIGELCAAYLGRPDMPRPTGDHNTDFTNEALHREALALHSQQRDRIRAIAGLAERAAKLMLS